MRRTIITLFAIIVTAVTAQAGLGKLTKPSRKAPPPQSPVVIPQADDWYPLGLSFAPTIAAFPSKDDGICGLRLGIISSNKEMHGLSLNLIGEYDGYSSCAIRLSPIWNSAYISRQSIDISAVLNMTGRAFLHDGSGFCSGAQIAFLMNFAFGDFNGLQLGAANFTQDFNGIQLGLINQNNISSGLMLGGCNYSRSFSGLQFGITNLCGKNGEGDAQGAHGLQIGGLNIADELHGLQLGVVNYAKAGHGLQIGILNFFGQEDSLVILPIANAKF